MIVSMEVGGGILFLTGLLLVGLGSFFLFRYWGRKRMPDDGLVVVEKDWSDWEFGSLQGRRTMSGRRLFKQRWLAGSAIGGLLAGTLFTFIPLPKVCVVEPAERVWPGSSGYHCEAHGIVGSYDGRDLGLAEKKSLHFSSKYMHNATSDTLYMYAVIYGNIGTDEYPAPDFYVLNPYSFQEVTELPWYEFSTAPSSVSVPEGSSGRVCWFLDTWEGILESQEGLQHWDSVIRNALIVNTMSDDSEE